MDAFLEIVASLFVGLVIMLVLLPFEFLSSMVGALWIQLFFNLSGITVLANIAYWPLVWLFMAGLTLVESGAMYARIAGNVVD